MIIAVDNGNYQTKTTHNIYISGLTEHSVKPPMADEIIAYGGSYWTLTHSRLPYKRDKTKDEYCFILTLFAIAKELTSRHITESNVVVSLAVGLPPQHFGLQRDRFAAYFMKHSPVVFTYNERQLRLSFSNIDVFPQAYAAVVPQAGKINTYSRLFVIDIGGYTTDVLLLTNGAPDLSFCHSVEMGTITMANSIMGKVNALHDMTITDDHIRDVLSGKQTVLSFDVKKTILDDVGAHAALTLDKLREFGVDLRSNPSIFIGGGSIMLREYIAGSNMVASPNFITDSRANAIGYEMLATAAQRSRMMPGGGLIENRG